MSTTLTTESRRVRLEEQRSEQEQAQARDELALLSALYAAPARRVGPADRLALRLGLALVTWGRRTATAESRERRAQRLEQQLARLARETAAEREARLLVPTR